MAVRPFLKIGLLCLFGVICVNGYVYETDDAVIVEAARTRHKRQIPYQANPPVSWAEAFGEGSACVTSSSQLGLCLTFRNCYPYFKVPDLSIWDQWVLGNYDTCAYFNKDGRQTYGVCCTNPQRPPASTVDEPPHKNDEKLSVTSNKETLFSNWPPQIPTHPPNHAAPTHPPYQTISATFSTQKWPQYTTTSTTTIRPSYDLDANCGAKNGKQDQERIVGGHNADPNEWPWIAVLFNGPRQFCGGSLIDQEHILTAAHCVAHMTSWDVARLTVRLGDHNIKSDSEVQHVERKIKRVVRHRNFDSRTLYSDVAVLTMDSPVTFNRNVRPICLPTAGSRLYHGQMGTVIGWGSLRENGPQPAILQKVTVPIWSNTHCQGKYGTSAPGGIIESMLCAGVDSKDSCTGDSGGPLMVNEGTWTQVGIVSWGIGCGEGQYPGVYTRVSSFIPWITKNIKAGK